MLNCLELYSNRAAGALLVISCSYRFTGPQRSRRSLLALFLNLIMGKQRTCCTHIAPAVFGLIIDTPDGRSPRRV